MRIAIISDIHNNITNLKKVLDYCAQNKAEKIICCGDLASMETLDFLNDNFSGGIYFCFGNMDDGQMLNYDFEKKYKNTWIFKDYGETEIKDKKVAFVHYPEKAKELCRTGKYDYVFYGHTHKPWVASAEATANQGRKKCQMLNPGNVAGEIYPPTFCVWNTVTDNFSLIRLHNLK